MTDLVFDVLDVTAERYAATPTLAVRLRIAERSGETVHAVALRCQVRIEPQRRGYSPAEHAGLVDLFGEPGRWGETVKPFLWTHATAMVPGFQGSTEIELPMTVTYDFEVAASKYLNALTDGAVPLVFLFSGTLFTRGSTGFAVTQIPWHHDAAYRMPVQVWRDVMDQYFPGGGWLRLDRETIAALQQFKSRRAYLGWDEAMAALLKAAGEEAP